MRGILYFYNSIITTLDDWISNVSCSSVSRSQISSQSSFSFFLVRGKKGWLCGKLCFQITHMESDFVSKRNPLREERNCSFNNDHTNQTSHAVICVLFQVLKAHPHAFLFNFLFLNYKVWFKLEVLPSGHCVSIAICTYVLTTYLKLSGTGDTKCWIFVLNLDRINFLHATCKKL